MDEADDLVLDSVGIEDFATWSEWALARVGFRPCNALALVGVCRDELMSDFDEAIAHVWGRPFQIGSLAGLVFLGRTGIQAALSHVPGEDGRHRFVAFCLPHLGIDGEGGIGRVQRRGMSRETTACGALAAYQAQLATGGRSVEFDVDDVEQSLLRARLSALLVDDVVPSLAELTQLARRAAVADVRTLVASLGVDEPVDVAYISGLLLHLPDGTDQVARVEAEVEIDGVVIPLPH
jgi:hypothetical protein